MGPFQKTIQDMPPEVLDVVFNFLDMDSRKNARLVCSNWYLVANLNMALRVILSDTTLNDFKGIRHTNIKDLRVSSLRMPLASCQSTTRSIFANKRVHHLLIAGNRGVSGVSEPNIKALLRILKDTKALTFENDALWTMKAESKFMNYFQMDHLTCLIVTIAPRWSTHIDKVPYSYLFKNTFPSLQSIAFKCDAQNISMDLIVELYLFICRHSGTLSDLKVTHTRSYHYTSKDDLRFKKSGICERIRQKLQKLRLKTLAYDHLVECEPHKGSQWQKLEWDLLHGQKKSLKIFHSHVQYPLESPNYKEIILNNQESLEDVYILTVSVPEPLFDCKWVEKCDNLTILNLCIINLGPRDVDRENYRNITLLPRKLTRVTFGTTILNWEVEWMAAHLKSLREICFCMKWKNYEENSLYQFKKFLTISTFYSYIILDYKCPVITLFASRTPGIKDRNSRFPFYTDIAVDRSLFNIANAIEIQL